MFNKIRAESLAGGEYIRREQIFSLQHETIYQLIYVDRLSGGTSISTYVYGGSHIVNAMEEIIAAEKSRLECL
jgi:hypothetical protein